MQRSLFFILLGLLCVNTSAEIYKWVDAEGNVQLTQTPPPAGVDYTTVQGNEPPPPAEPPEAGKEAAKPDKAAATKEGKQMTEEEAKKAEEEAKAAKEKAAAAKRENCRQAQEQMKTLTANAGILIPDKDNPDKLMLMNDEERKKRTEEMQGFVDRFCNNTEEAQ